MSLRPAWSTELVPGQAPKLQRNLVSKNHKEEEGGEGGGGGRRRGGGGTKLKPKQFLFFLSVLAFLDRVSLYSFGACPGTSSVDQAGL